MYDACLNLHVSNNLQLIWGGVGAVKCVYVCSNPDRPWKSLLFNARFPCFCTLGVMKSTLERFPSHLLAGCRIAAGITVLKLQFVFYRGRKRGGGGGVKMKH